MAKAIDSLKVAASDLGEFTRNYDDQFRDVVTTADIDRVIAKLVQAKFELANEKTSANSL